VGTGDLAPDDADPGAADLLLGLVHVGDLLAEVEAVLRISNSAMLGVKTGYSYFAASVLSTPSILMRLVAECVTWRERW
jgi:hypothetical protein